MFERDRRRIASFAPVRRNWIEFNSESSPPLVSPPKGGGGLKIRADSWKRPPLTVFGFAILSANKCKIGG